MTPSTLALARRVRALLEAPERWTQGAVARDLLNEPVEVFSDRAVCWCLAGAIDVSEVGDRDASNNLWDALDAAAGRQFIKWNDAPGRTHADVLALLDRVVQRMERENG